MRIRRGKACDRVTERQCGKGLRRENLERAFGLFLQPLEGSFFLFDLFDNLLAKLKMFRSSFGKSNPARRSREQTDAQVLFEISDMTRDQRTREP